MFCSLLFVSHFASKVQKVQGKGAKVEEEEKQTRFVWPRSSRWRSIWIWNRNLDLIIPFFLFKLINGLHFNYGHLEPEISSHSTYYFAFRMNSIINASSDHYQVEQPHREHVYAKRQKKSKPFVRNGEVKQRQKEKNK